MTETETDVILYTAQSPVVLETLERDGVSRVKLAYIDRKYGDTSWVFQEAYSFFRQNASALLPKPDGAESPIWLFADSRWCFMGPDSVLMTFRIPRQQVLFFNLSGCLFQFRIITLYSCFIYRAAYPINRCSSALNIFFVRFKVRHCALWDNWIFKINDSVVSWVFAKCFYYR